MMSKHHPGAQVTVASLSFSGRLVMKRDEDQLGLDFSLLALLAARLQARLT